MGFLFCVACLFTFPKPTADDIDDVRRVMERTYAQRSQPWSEVGGPYAKVDLHLLTPGFGIADARMTTVGSTWLTYRDVRVAVKKAGGEWTIFHPE